MFNFTINSKDNKARTGMITTSHGSIKTPAFIPVATQAAIKSLSAQQVTSLGFDAMLCNTYHLYLRPGEKIVQTMGGLQKFMGWNKPLFTDSGGFQVFSLHDGLVKVDNQGVTFKSYIDSSSHRFTPEKSMQIQYALGADIIFTFDECIHFDVDYVYTKKAMQRTHQWALRCINEFERLESSQALYGIVQGGQFEDLRKESAEFIASCNVHGFGIGGIFGDPKKESQRIVAHTIGYLPYDKPKHMLGIGSVDDLFFYVEMGADTFDCVLPTRLARYGIAFILPQSGGSKENKFRFLLNSSHTQDTEPLDSHCFCSTCTNHSRSYLRHLMKAKEIVFYQLMTTHNLHFFSQLMLNIRSAIQEKRFRELKQQWLG
jgi:queuine tRNA-ribosyltransferase